MCPPAKAKTINATRHIRLEKFILPDGKDHTACENLTVV